MTQPIHRHALEPGSRLHWYRIERVLGSGGFGITYLARDLNLDLEVAIKEFLPEFAIREKDFSVQPKTGTHAEMFKWGLDRFMIEARTLTRFNHPNIVRVLTVFDANRTGYMVMAFEHGETLKDILDRRYTLKEDELLKILLPILDGLEAVHARGFIHRDIKPANLFIRDDGSPVLIDFGSARQALGFETQALTTVVTPGYAPFEQYYSKGQRQGPWTDIYSLGATLYRAVTGEPPQEAVERSRAILESTLDPLEDIRNIAQGRYSAHFLTAIHHALRFRANERPQTIAEWRLDLRIPQGGKGRDFTGNEADITEIMSNESSRGPVPGTDSPRKRRTDPDRREEKRGGERVQGARKRFPVALGVLVVVIVGASFWAFIRIPADSDPGEVKVVKIAAEVDPAAGARKAAEEKAKRDREQTALRAIDAALARETMRLRYWPS